MSKPELLRTVIPALPGYSIVQIVDNPTQLLFEPILAWIVEIEAPSDGDILGMLVDSSVTPVTAEGSGELYYERIIRYPDGRIIDPHNRTYGVNDLAELMRDMVNNRERYRAAQDKLLKQPVSK